MAINAGAVANVNTFGTYGGNNNHPDLDSFMMCTYQSIEGSTMFIANQDAFPYNAYVKNIYVSDCRWAIGGHHLRLTSTFSSKSNFISALSSGAHIYNPSTTDERSFIGYGGGYVYLCTCHDGCDLYDEHLILKKLGCSMGMNIDGGGSVLISHKNGHTQVESSRYVATMLRVNY